MKPVILLSGIFLLASIVCQAQVKPIAIEKLDSIMQKQPKPALVLLTAPWCSYCALQKIQLKQNKDFAQKASGFYYTEFDTENTKYPVTFNSKTYNYYTAGSANGINTLAEALSGSKRLSYPTLIVVDKQRKVLWRHEGVISGKQIISLIAMLSAK